MRREFIKFLSLQQFKRTTPASRRRQVTATLLLMPLLLLSDVQAQSVETSWFEIEILAFSRDSNQRLLEQFPTKVTEVSTQGSVDLLSPLYQRDLTSIMQAMPACQTPTISSIAAAELSLAIADVTQPLFVADAAGLAEFLFLQTKLQLPLPDIGLPLPQLCVLDQQPARLAMLNPILPGAIQILQDAPALLPLTPAGQEQHQSTPYLAPESALQLKDLAYQLRHRGNHQLLLHTAWRQPLAGRRSAQSYRWFAGSNFGQQFDYYGRAKTSIVTSATAQADQFVQQISALEQVLAQNPATPLAELQLAARQQNNHPVWQLDGLVRVYSERMLFAETNFNLRRLSPDGSTLSTYHSSDQSRLLIGDIHYLDHPYLGLILQIRRFTPPLNPAAGASMAPAAQPQGGI